jgi:hypothetical protein
VPRLVGSAAVAFSVIYVLSDLIELVQGGFSTVQLLLTYAAEAAIPLFVPGLWAVQRPLIGWLGLAGAIGYAYSYVFFTGTVLYSLVAASRDWTDLLSHVDPWMTVHGAVMVAAAVCFGIAVARAGVFPRWTGYALAAGVVLVAATNTLPDPVRTVAAVIRAAAFIGMGAATLRMDGRAAREEGVAG